MRFDCFLLAVLVATSPALSLADEDKDDSAGAQRPADEVRLTSENLEHVQVKVEPVRLGTLKKLLRVPGRVSANLNKTAVITSTLEGRVSRLDYDLNDSVRPGDVLGLVDSPELLGKPFALKAPVGGIIVDRKRSVGEAVAKDTEIYRISDPSVLWVIAEIRERDLANVRVGQQATFRVISSPERSFSGKVTRVGSEVEEKSRTVEVRIDTENSSGLLKAGMFADVEILSTVIENVPLIADGALQTMGPEQVVFVAAGENTFKKRVVKLGEEQDGTVQVVSGVEPGERVVTEGSFVLKSELLKGELGEDE